MAPISTDWTKEEFDAYVLLYAAENNVQETRAEEQIIHKRFKDEVFKKMLNEIRHDNEYQRLAKILYTAEKLNYTQEEIEPLLEEVKELFLSDNEFDMAEKSIFLALKHILTR
jgi:hypothetical protein